LRAPLGWTTRLDRTALKTSEARLAIVLVPYDPNWASQFEAMATELRGLGNSEWLVEHIGSTAIPGIMAKPIIDAAVRIADREDFDRHRAGLESGGWRLGSRVRTHLVMVEESGGQRTRIAHFFERSDWETANQRLLRDWLLSHPEDAAAYERAKLDAAEDARQGKSSYNAGKTAIIQRLVDRARAERGLQPVAVHDK
jgi:GrpB-like predicted nucleotidyltransferase (UPF0157 family)